VPPTISNWTELPSTWALRTSRGLPHRHIINLKQRLNLHTTIRAVDLIQFLAEVEQPILDRFGVDVVDVFRPETNPG